MSIEVLTASQVLAYVMLDLALILVAARLVGGLCVRLGQPRVVGEIIAGVLLGPTLLGSFSGELFPAQAQPVLGGIGQVGLLIFSFLIGLEMEMTPLLQNLRKVVIVGIGVVAIPLVGGFAIAPAMANGTFQVEGTSAFGFTLFLGAMLAVTALPVMVRILQEKGLTRSSLGATSIAAAVICTVAMFVTASAATTISKGEAGAAVLADLGLIAVYLAAMLFVVTPLMERLAGSLRSTGELSPGMMAGLFILMFTSGWISQTLGLSVIVGGFLAGLSAPVRTRLFEIMDDKLGVMTATVLLPVFLAVSGLATNFRELSGAALTGLALFLATAILSKWVGGAVLARGVGLSWREGNTLGILMNCRGLLVLVVALAGVQAGVITPVLQLGAVLVALVTTAMTGPLFDRSTRPSQVAVEG